MANYGFVYILSNKAMPGIYKIGCTEKSPSQRASQLSTTGVPFPFEVVVYGEIDNFQQFEHDLHERFKEFRINEDREFFRLTPDFLIDGVCNIIKEECDTYAEGIGYHEQLIVFLNGGEHGKD